jgi:hypothetical protein
MQKMKLSHIIQWLLLIVAIISFLVALILMFIP